MLAEIVGPWILRLSAKTTPPSPTMATQAELSSKKHWVQELKQVGFKIIKVIHNKIVFITNQRVQFRQYLIEQIGMAPISLDNLFKTKIRKMQTGTIEIKCLRPKIIIYKSILITTKTQRILEIYRICIKLENQEGIYSRLLIL